MKGRIIKWVFIVILLVVGVGVFTLWRRVDVRVKRLLLPSAPMYAGYTDLPERTQGVETEPFVVQGSDGTKVQACIVRKATGAEELTPLQHALLDRLQGRPLQDLRALDYVLVCVDWDHGIRSALPLAEQLAAAGLNCVLWEPRGSQGKRPWCTHGLKESADIPLIIDALEARAQRQGLMIAGIGYGFGAELMLQAAAREPRLRAVVAVNPEASLNKTLKRAHVSTLMRELIGWRMNQLTGLEPFDIAAVKSAALIPREVPVMLVYEGGQQSESSLDDAVAIFTQLQSDMKRLLTLRNSQDAQDATTRTIIYAPEGGTREVLQKVEVELTRDAEEVPEEILRWLDACVNPLQESPLPSTLIPNRSTSD